MAAAGQDLVSVRALRTVKARGAYRRPGDVFEMARPLAEELNREGAVALLPSPPVPPTPPTPPAPSLAATGYKGFKPLGAGRKKKR